MLPGKIGAIARWIIETYPADQHNSIAIRISFGDKKIIKQAGPYCLRLENTQGHTLYGFVETAERAVALSESCLGLRCTEALAIDYRRRIKGEGMTLSQIISAPNIPDLRIERIRPLGGNWCELDLRSISYQWQPHSDRPYRQPSMPILN